MRRTSAVVILCVLSITAWGQEAFPRRHIVDSMVLSWNLTDYHDADELTDTLTSSFNNDSDKVRAIYFWVTQYVSYDLQKLKQDYNITLETNHDITKDGFVDKDKQIQRALIRKKGICQDYADLFAYMCNSAKIKCQMVDGTGMPSTGGFMVGAQAGSMRHAWNVVMINKKWYLIDPTWASGGCSGDKFIRLRNDFYYLTPPDVFIKDHYPFDTDWQLLYPPVDYKTFIKGVKGKSADQ